MPAVDWRVNVARLAVMPGLGALLIAAAFKPIRSLKPIWSKPRPVWDERLIASFDLLIEGVDELCQIIKRCR